LSRADKRTLIDWGRKSGLTTSELYSALAARPAAAGDQANEQADGNGFVSGLNENGQRVYRPANGQQG
jgi:hypothetical protein